LFLLAGNEVVLAFFSSWAPDWFVEAVSSLSFLTHFSSIERGIISMPDLIFFASLIVGCLAACGIVLEIKKAE
jgi:ABC-2 type transport system permease protein